VSLAVREGRLALTFALTVCDGLELFARGATVGRHFDASGVRRGVDAVGSASAPPAPSSAGRAPVGASCPAECAT
jgi:hypothetical protein